MNIGIFGGTFDPPHLGHLSIALSAISSGNVDKVILIPTSTPPHKSRTDITPDLHRLRMTEILVAEHENLSVSDIEIKRQGLSYTILTINELRLLHPDDEFRLIIGADMALSFDLWKNAEEIIDIAPPLIAARPGYTFDTEFGRTLPKGLPLLYREKLLQGIFKAPLIDISSTELRQTAKLRSSNSSTSNMSQRVSDYIIEHNLYCK